MYLYHCELNFHDNLFYETRTMGRLYETGRLLHNIALAYALGFAASSYHQVDFAPRYAEELASLNERRIYITPAAGVDVHYAVHTFKYGEERTSVHMNKSNRNLPTFGRAKEIAVGSRFAFGVLTPDTVTLPRWIRMGIWMSKARLQAVQIPLTYQEGEAEQVVAVYPLNPNDLPADATLKIFDLVSMRPTSLVENPQIKAAGWWRGEIPGYGTVHLPGGMQYRLGGR